MKKLILTFAVLLAIKLTNSSYIQADCGNNCKGQLQACLAPFNIPVVENNNGQGNNQGNNGNSITIVIVAGNGVDNTAAIYSCINAYNVCKTGCPDAPTLFVTYPPLTRARLI